MVKVERAHRRTAGTVVGKAAYRRSDKELPTAKSRGLAPGGHIFITNYF